MKQIIMKLNSNTTFMRDRYGVYVHTNKVNGKKYVGITTTDPKKRWANGYGYLRKKNGHYSQSKFANAIIKYGGDGFEHQYWEVYSKESMIFGEKFLIEKYDSMRNGYNCTNGGEHCRLSEETRQKLSEAHKKNAVWLGKHHTEETRKKISDSHKGIRNRSKPVVQYTIDGRLIKEYSTITEAAIETGSSLTRLCEAVKNNKTFKNYVGKYRK